MIRVQKRLNSIDGMDLAELLYQTMQAYDFAYLYKNKSVNTQVRIQFLVTRSGEVINGVTLCLALI